MTHKMTPAEKLINEQMDEIREKLSQLSLDGLGNSTRCDNLRRRYIQLGKKLNDLMNK